MPFWLTFLIFAAVTVVGELLRPKPRFEDARPAGLGDFQFPTATEGRAVPLVWGTVRIKAPNVVWYGDLRQRAITEEVQTGMFSSDEVTTGYRYIVGIQFAICRGPVDSCQGVRINDKFADAGRNGAGDLSINAPNLLGGIEFGSGGVTSSYGKFYVGDDTQAVDSYLDGKISGDVPAFRGTCYYMFEGYVGTSPNIPPWSFDVRRIPDGLDMATADPGAEAIDVSEANPMNVIYEIMTDTDWGLKIPVGDIDVPSFRAAASTLATEVNGFSFVLDGEKEASEVINEVLRQIDGVLYFDRSLGLWKITLVRDDYVAASQPLYDDSNIISLNDYSRTTWSETTNQVRLLFDDTDDNFKRAYALAQDMANIEIQGGNVSAEVKYPGCKKRALANQLAWRELGTLAYPLAKHTITVDRNGFDLRPGSVYRWSNARLGISELVMRVVKIDFGTLDSGTVRIVAAQDIFATPGPAVFGDPSPTGWDGAENDPVPVVAADVLAFECPRQIVIQGRFPEQLRRVWAGARDPGGGTVGFEVFTRKGAARPLGSIYDNDFSISNFLLTGTLNADLGAYDGAPSVPRTGSLVIDDEDVLSSLRHVDQGFGSGSSNVATLRNLAYIDGEFIGFGDATYTSGVQQLTITQVWRGLFHTAPKDHAAGTRIWFISNGGNLDELGFDDTDAEMDLKLRSRNQFELITEALTPTTEVSLESSTNPIWAVPLAPRDPVVNTVYAPSTAVNVDTDWTTETGLTGDDGLGVSIGITPRAWRVNSITGDTELSNISGRAWEEDLPTFDYVVVLDPSGTPATTAAVSAAGSGTAVPDAYVLRNAMIVALGANREFPTDARIEVTAKHTPPEIGAVVTNPVPLTFPMTITSALQSADDLTFGGLDVGTPSDAVVFGETGTYNFDIHTALPSSGILEARVNGGSFVTVVAASSTTGTLAITASDSVELRFSQAPASDQFFDITGPTSEQGYGVLQA